MITRVRWARSAAAQSARCRLSDDQVAVLAPGERLRLAPASVPDVELVEEAGATAGPVADHAGDVDPAAVTAAHPYHRVPSAASPHGLPRPRSRCGRPGPPRSVYPRLHHTSIASSSRSTALRSQWHLRGLVVPPQQLPQHRDLAVTRRSLATASVPSPQARTARRPQGVPGRSRFSRSLGSPPPCAYRMTTSYLQSGLEYPISNGHRFPLNGMGITAADRLVACSRSDAFSARSVMMTVAAASTCS